MFTQANDLVAILGDIVVLSLLLSTGAFVATLLGEWSVRSNAECYLCEVRDYSMLAVSVPPIGAHLTAVRSHGPSLTLILGGRRDGQVQGRQVPRGALKLVHARPVRGATSERARRT